MQKRPCIGNMGKAALCISPYKDNYTYSVAIFFQDNLGMLIPGLTILDFNEARDDGAAVPLVGLYANHLHFSTDEHASS